MNLASLGSFGGNDIGSIFGRTIQDVTLPNNNSSASSGAVSGGQYSDSSQLSPLGQILGALQQAQQSSPAEYQQLTQLIATSLQQTAQQTGNSPATNQLSQLATEFSNAANTGGLPNIGDLAGALGAGGNADYYGGTEDSFSIQISVSEVSINSGTQAGPINSNTVSPPSGGNQAAPQQSEESALLYQFNLTETSVSYANQDTTSQLTQQAAHQLIGLIEQSLDKAAQSAQASGNAGVAQVLSQLETDFTNALNAGGQSATQGSTDSSGSTSSTSGAGSSSGSQIVLEQFQESLLAYQANGNAINQYAFSPTGTNYSLSAVA